MGGEIHLAQFNHKQSSQTKLTDRKRARSPFSRLRTNTWTGLWPTGKRVRQSRYPTMHTDADQQSKAMGSRRNTFRCYIFSDQLLDTGGVPRNPTPAERQQEQVGATFLQPSGRNPRGGSRAGAGIQLTSLVTRYQNDTQGNICKTRAGAETLPNPWEN